MISAYLLVIGIGWVWYRSGVGWRSGRRVASGRRPDRDVDPAGEELALGGLGGEPEVVVGVLALEVGELRSRRTRSSRVVVGVEPDVLGVVRAVRITAR